MQGDIVIFYGILFFNFFNTFIEKIDYLTFKQFNYNLGFIDFIDFIGLITMDNPREPSIFSQEFAANYTTQDIENIFNKTTYAHKENITSKDLEIMFRAFAVVNDDTIRTREDYNSSIGKLSRRFAKTTLIKGYRILLRDDKIPRMPNLERFMRMKPARGDSGIIQLTVMTAPVQFGLTEESKIMHGGCPHKCTYCPLEIDDDGTPTQPRSYLSTEPGNKRATQNKHHPLGQVFDRLSTLEKMGHIPSIPGEPTKIEFMISGGTFNFYPENYIIWFTTMCYYALNIYYDYTLSGNMRPVLSLEEEQRINETAFIRMIGLTIETRPDYLYFPKDPNPFKCINLLRRLGVTRVQTGTQHTDDDILRGIKRGCTDAQNQLGNRILMDNGFKVDNHWMLDLPGSSPELDKAMIDYIINHPNYQVDQLKIYPTMVTQFSELYNMYQRGEYQPYAELEEPYIGAILEDVIIHFKRQIPPYMRINRIIRDIPPESVYGGVNCPEMRANIQDKMSRANLQCHCIRCREIKADGYDPTDCHLFIQEYAACDGVNYFISYENATRTKLYGFIRLRFPSPDSPYMLQILKGHAVIRELHVYGAHTGVSNTLPIHPDQQSTHNTQHRGLGKALLQQAETIASRAGYSHITVIAGVGVKEYYRRRGYQDYETYLTKTLIPESNSNSANVYWLLPAFAMLWMMPFIFV